jgi:glutamate--cysteine ligase
VCTTFVDGRKHELKELAPGTLYLPHATSLRMGRLGYQSDAQSSLVVSANNLTSYAASLHEALINPYPAYEKIGIKDKDSYRQLSTSLLQIENEFYSPIRPKRRIKSGERPLHALRERGVEYVEVRLMDLDPFTPVGITAQTMRFLDILLLHCLLEDSPPDTPQELEMVARNKLRGAQEGRKPGLRLERRGDSVTLAEWGKEVLDACEPIAAELDATRGGTGYRDALQAAHSVLADAESAPSARVRSMWCLCFGSASEPFPLPCGPWQRAQFSRKSRRPSASDTGVTATGFFSSAAAAGSFHALACAAQSVNAANHITAETAAIRRPIRR